MCGIVGTLSFKASGRGVDERLLVAMRDTMVHRGPDGGGLWVSADSRVGFGHRRLAIIDLSEAANQPMQNPEDTLSLVFNGEVYNHAEIRKELIALGHTVWKTDHSDSEVVLRAFEQWGIECLSRFRGMFALAIWDSVKRELWLARDRLGIKPLYYSLHGGRFSFASEIKALLSDPGHPRELDEAALFHFLSFLATPGPETLFQGVRKLPCGRWLRVSESGEMREERYWDALTHAAECPETGTAAGQVLDRLRESVALRKVSDVPVGVFLSGGLDSTSNAALFREGEALVKTYNVAFEGDNASYQNEHEHAREAAKFVGAEHHEVFLNSEDALAFLPQMVEFQDEPIADPVCVPLYFVAKLAREDGTIVCQVGEGADELFCGYNQWRYMLKLAGLADTLPGPLKRLGLSALDLIGKGNSPMRERWRRAVAGMPPFWSGAEAFTQPEKDLILSDSLKKRVGPLTSWDVIRPHWEHFQTHAPERSHLNWMTYVDLNLRLPEMLLMRVDKMTMAVSLEARVPFLDHKLVELVMGLPSNTKYQGGELKPLLKQAVRGLIPEATIQRKKQGFGIPIDEWFDQRLGGFAREKVLAFSRRTDLFDAGRVERWLPQASTKQIWYLLNLALWHERFLEGCKEVGEAWVSTRS
ncbi:MAG: asparagine synthase (glutamine-hydrolyzing) [Armatimonadetes bacterium]|nr:asparagine synthase (glutamine-hydrolyzing) [Armatimonadota bacterium]